MQNTFSAKTVEYSLTDKGMDFKTALKEMEKWAMRWDSQERQDSRA